MSSEIAIPGQPAGTYQGWWVLSATFACAMLVIGSTNYAFQLFVVPVQTEFGLSRAAVNQGMSLFLIGGALWAPIAGRLLDRFPAPAVMAAGGASIGLGMAAIAASSSLAWIAGALVGPMALGAMCAGGLANTTIVSRWFRRRRGRALGIATVSSGAGGFVMVQLITALIARHGWRGALVWTGAIIALGVGALALFVVRSRPDDAALAQAGEHASGIPGEGRPAEQTWSFAELVRRRNFWCITFGTGLLMASDGALLASKMPYLLGIGIEAQSASFLIACMTASSVAGKLGIGLAADRMDLRRLFTIVAVCHVILLLVLIAEPGYGVLLVAVSLFGVGVGGVYPLLATLTAEAFGSASYGSVAGTMQLVLLPISIGLVTFIGASHDRTGDYTLAFEVFIGLVFLAGALIALVELPPRVVDARHEDHS
ncbi:MAG: MFS transporter [Deltaproteobacteria bacterium]|nr:MFS transporter [Deltaproteobacteria bacterium]